MTNLALLLARNGFLPAAQTFSGTTPAGSVALGTVLSSLASYGIAPNTLMVEKLRGLSRADLADWWGKTETVVRKITGADRNMDDFVVYKNFPAEVLEKSEGEYWLAQIFMYIGAPNDWFTEAALPRPDMDDRLDLKIFSEGTQAGILSVCQKLFAQKSAWNDEMKEDILSLHQAGFVDTVDFSIITSRENAAWLSVETLKLDKQSSITVDTPMDVLRIAAAWSGIDAGLRVPGRLASFPRWLRRAMTTWLSRFSQDRLEADFAMRSKAWKPLLHALHTGSVPGALGKATNSLRNGKIETFDSKVEKGLKDRNREVLFLLAERPGVFARRLHHAYARFGALAIETFITDKVLKDLSVEQLLKLDGYFAKVNTRNTFLYTPRGQMSKAQLGENTKATVDSKDVAKLRTALAERIKTRLDKAFPEGFDVKDDAFNIGLLLNGQESGVGRGTVFDIPKSMTFVRTASFWKTGGDHYGNIWFDNGWVFFDKNWQDKGGVAWDHIREDSNKKTLGVFSGDPTNSKDLEGRACQMIDLYLDNLEEAGVAYAVWNILSFNSMPFGDANDVLATLQWGEHAEKGKLYEPARAQIVLPLEGPDKGKVVAMLDVKARKLIFIDGNLPMNVRSAMANTTGLAEKMPALLEAMDSTPSVGDLFSLASPGTIPVCYSETSPVTGKALVFKPIHPDSAFTPLDVSAILALTD